MLYGAPFSKGFIKNFEAPYTSAIAKDQGVKNKIVQDKKLIEKTLESMDSSSSLKDLIHAMNGIVDANAKATGASSDTISMGSSLEMKALEKLSTLIQEQIEIDNHLMYSSSNPNKIEKISDYEEMLLENSQSNVFESLKTLFSNEIKNLLSEEGSLQTAIINAETGFWHMIGHALFGVDYGQADKEKLANIKAQVAAITKGEGGLASFGADLEERMFSSVMSAANEIMKQVQEVLANPKLTKKEKAQDLKKLLVFMLSLLETFMQVVQNTKTDNRQKMEKANSEAQRLNLQQTQANLAILQDAQKAEQKAKIIQDIVKAIEITVTAVFIATGRVGMAAMMITTFVLQETGELTKWSKELAEKEGSQAGADATIAGISLVGTLIGGIGIDMAVERAISEIVTEESEEGADEVAEETTDLVSDQTNEATQNTTKTLSKEVSRSIIKREVGRSLYNRVSLGKVFGKVFQALIQAAKSVAGKESEEGFITLFKNQLKTEVKNGAEKEIKAALETFNKEFAKISGKDEAEISESELKAVAKKAAKEIIKKAEKEGKAFKFFNKMTGGTLSRLTTDLDKFCENLSNSISEKFPRVGSYVLPNLKNALYASVFTLAGINLVDQIPGLDESSTASSKGKNKNEILKMLAEIIQMVVEMIAMVKAGGVDSPSEGLTNFEGNLLKVNALAQFGSGMAQGISSIEQGDAVQKQAYSQKNLQLIQNKDQMIEVFEKQDSTAANDSQQFTAHEEQLVTQEQDWLAAHMWDNLFAGSQVLAAQSV